MAITPMTSAIGCSIYVQLTSRRKTCCGLMLVSMFKAEETTATATFLKV